MMLTLAALSRAFGGLRVIDRLDLTVEAGEILGILGPNGAGKSTLFNLIGGVLPPSGGRILLEGRDITQMKPWDRSRIGIGRTYQVPKPFTHMTVFENVLVAAVHGGKMSVAHAPRLPAMAGRRRRSRAGAAGSRTSVPAPGGPTLHLKAPPGQG